MANIVSMLSVYMDNDKLVASSVLAWIVMNKMVNENQKPLEFSNHRFLIDYMADDAPLKVTKKAAQVGLTVAETLISFHEAAFRGHNTIHTLQTMDVIKGFVFPKVNPIIRENPAISSIVTKDSENLKQVGSSFIYYRGAQAESQAINISADILNIDEYDRSNPQVVAMYPSRLDASTYRRLRYFSNPSAVGYGVDKLYNESNQMHWFITCHKCNHEWFIDWEKADKNHYVDVEQGFYACGKCGRELSDTDRRNGRWVAAYPTRESHGYWFSQLMAPWKSAHEIISKSESEPIDIFYNMTLGKAYTSADLLIDRQAFIDAMRPGKPAYRNVVMGSDIGKPHWYWLGTPDGVFKVGHADSWDELERLFLLYKCEAWVIDAMPEFTKVQEMLRKYHGRAFACYFVRDSKDIGIVRWMQGDKYGTVHVDRTKIIDRVVNEIASGDIKFYAPLKEMEELIRHAANMYRTVETDERGRIKVDWNTPDGKPDHLMFAGVYWRIALEQAFSGVGHGVVETVDPDVGVKTGPVVNGKMEVEFDIESSLERAQHLEQ